MGAARRLAADLGCAVLLKGDATVVADADGTAFVNGTGTPWLATAGTGDVLAGIAGALLATGLPAVEAGAVAAHLHGRTGPAGRRARDRCSPATSSAACRRRSAGCAGFRRAAWETRRRDEPQPARAEVVVDLDAIAANTAVLRERVGRPLMAVVKADGYGHGLVPAARAVLAGGADALGVAVLDEALALRAAGITAPLLAWLHGPGTDYAAALDRRRRGLGERRLGAGRGGRRGPRHRAHRPRAPQGRHRALAATGATPADWPALVEAAARAQADGDDRRRRAVEPHGLRRRAHPPHDRRAGRASSRRRWRSRRAAGLTDARLHLANSAATVALPDTWYDMVRPGIALYGLDPLGGHDPTAHGLRPAMTVRAAGRPDQAGAGRRRASPTATPTSPSARPRWPWCRSATPTACPRAAGNRAPVLAARRAADHRRPGLHGPVRARRRRRRRRARATRSSCGVPGDRGEPTAQQWADAVDTIHYELVTRIGGRFARRYVGSAGAV